MRRLGFLLQKYGMLEHSKEDLVPWTMMVTLGCTTTMIEHGEPEYREDRAQVADGRGAKNSSQRLSTSLDSGIGALHNYLLTCHHHHPSPRWVETDNLKLLFLY